MLKRNVPLRLIEYAAISGSKKLKLASIANQRTPREILEKLAGDSSSEVIESAGLHINNSQAQRTDLEEFAAAKIQQQVMRSEREFSEIMSSVSEIIRPFEHIPRCISHYMGYYPFKKNTAPINLADVKKAIENKVYLDYEGMAINPNTPVEILEELALSHLNDSVHRRIAMNPITPLPVLKILLDKPPGAGFVCEALGSNENFSPSMLVELAHKCQYESTCISLFNNPKTPDSLIEELIRYFQQRNTIPIYQYGPHHFIANSRVPGEFLEWCLEIALEKLAIANQSKFSRSDIVTITHSNLLEAIAFHPNMTSKGFVRIFGKDHRGLRSSAMANYRDLLRSAIANYRLPQYITEEFGMSFLKKLNVVELKTLAANFHATEELLKELVKHEDITVSRAAASNPCASDEVLEAWEASPFYKPGALESVMNEEQRLLDRWESSVSAADRLTALLNKQAPVALLAKVSRTSSWVERYAIARHPNTPNSIVKRLENDGNLLVRSVANRYLSQL